MPHLGLTNQRRLSARSMRRLSASYGLGTLTCFAPLAAGTLNCNYTLETMRGRDFVKHHVGMRPADLAKQHWPGVLSDIVDYFWWSKLNDLWILDRHYVQADPIADVLLAPTLEWLRWLLEHRAVLVSALDDAAHVDSGQSGT
jgi:hypothetical protein